MAGRQRMRRRWSQEEKRRIVAQTLMPRASVSQVARRYDVNTNLVFTWRRRARPGTVLAALANPLLPGTDRGACASPSIPTGTTTGAERRCSSMDEEKWRAASCPTPAARSSSAQTPCTAHSRSPEPARWGRRRGQTRRTVGFNTRAAHWPSPPQGVTWLGLGSGSGHRTVGLHAYVASSVAIRTRPTRLRARTAASNPTRPRPRTPELSRRLSPRAATNSASRSMSPARDRGEGARGDGRRVRQVARIRSAAIERGHAPLGDPLGGASTPTPDGLPREEIAMGADKQYVAPRSPHQSLRC